MSDFLKKFKSVLGANSGPKKATVSGVRKEIDRLKAENADISEKWDRAGKSYEAGRSRGMSTKLEEGAIDRFSRAHEHNEQKIARYTKATNKAMSNYHTNMAKQYQVRDSKTPLAPTQFND